MNLSAQGLDLIRRHEGLRLDAYPDPGSKDGLPVTIGYGSTRRLDGVTPWQLGDRITEEQATELLLLDVFDTEDAVRKAVKVPLSQSQFDALVSFAYNVGIGAFRSSTLLRLLNAGDYAGAQAQFARWNLNDGKPLAGLTNRRKAEAALFATPADQHALPEQPPAPIVESVPVYVREEPMNPFLVAAFPSLVQAIPGLIRSFGSGEVTERNAKAVEAVVQVVQQATGTPNAQAAVEAVQSDPAARSAATEALAADHWFETTEAGGGGIEGSRAFSTALIDTDPKRLPAFWVTLLLLPMIYLVVGAVLFADGFTPEMRGMVIGAVVSGALSAIVAFWLGSSFGSYRKDRAAQ